MQKVQLKTQYLDRKSKMNSILKSLRKSKKRFQETCIKYRKIISNNIDMLYILYNVNDNIANNVNLIVLLILKYFFLICPSLLEQFGYKKRIIRSFICIQRDIFRRTNKKLKRRKKFKF